jgi:hypothetical protein
MIKRTPLAFYISDAFAAAIQDNRGLYFPDGSPRLWGVEMDAICDAGLASRDAKGLGYLAHAAYGSVLGTPAPAGCEA